MRILSSRRKYVLPRLNIGVELAAKPGQAFAAEANQTPRDGDLEEIVERLVTHDLDRRTRRETEFLPVAKPFGVIVLGFSNDDALSGPKL